MSHRIPCSSTFFLFSLNATCCYGFWMLIRFWDVHCISGNGIDDLNDKNDKIIRKEIFSLFGIISNHFSTFCFAFHIPVEPWCSSDICLWYDFRSLNAMQHSLHWYSISSSFFAFCWDLIFLCCCLLLFIWCLNALWRKKLIWPKYWIIIWYY